MPKTAVTALVAAARRIPASGRVNPQLRDALTSHALDVALDGLWGALDQALAKESSTVSRHVLEALSHVAQHPVFEAKNGQVYNGKLFAIPVSQLMQGSTYLQHLPAGDLVEQLLTQALCPNGKGVLVNRLMLASEMEALSCSQLWQLAENAFENAEPANSLQEIYGPVEPGILARLCFVPFFAFVPADGDLELLTMAPEDLDVLTDNVIMELNRLVQFHLTQDRKMDVLVSLHQMQSFYYDQALAGAAHETFMLAAMFSQWKQVSIEEGVPLSVLIELQELPEQLTQISAQASLDGEVRYRYALEAPNQDEIVQSELCASVAALGAEHDIEVRFEGMALSLLRAAEQTMDDDGRFVIAAPNRLQ